jgi:primosomal replication protein N''
VLASIWKQSKGRRPSVGIVTFNVKQADLIEELLEQRAEQDEDFRQTYADESARKDQGEDMSIFVKNVENVQGDERDYILFSTTFGRNRAGLFRRNFGVLGQAGGERRLNVAVTRAKRKVIIVGSMPIDEISDMLRTRRRPETPRDYLQAYLHYATLVSDGQLKESRSLVERITANQTVSISSDRQLDGFQQSVAQFIRDLGHDDPVLGVDFSIRDPRSGEFGMAIECDPPRHRLIRRAKAREIWRPSLLARIYPVIHQVSAIDWYRSPQKERERLRQQLVQTFSSHGDAP